MLRSSYPAMLNTARMILEDSNSVRASENCMSVKEILNLIKEQNDKSARIYKIYIKLF